MLKLAKFGKYKASEFSAKDRYNLMDLFVNNE